MENSMNYETASEFEINEAVAKLAYPECDKQFRDVPSKDAVSGYIEGINIYIVDYCNNPSDAWPIIESIWWELLNADFLGVTEWAKEIRSDAGTGKLRAAMIVFLKMKEAEL